MAAEDEADCNIYKDDARLEKSEFWRKIKELTKRNTELESELARYKEIAGADAAGQVMRLIMSHCNTARRTEHYSPICAAVTALVARAEDAETAKTQFLKLSSNIGHKNYLERTELDAQLLATQKALVDYDDAAENCGFYNIQDAYKDEIHAARKAVAS